MEYSNWVAGVSVMIQNVFGADREFDFRRFDADIGYREDIKEIVRLRAFDLVRNSVDDDSQRKKFLNDFDHYDQFLGRCYSDLREFIENVEGYKTS